jgi:hypothetical protein
LVEVFDHPKFDGLFSGRLRRRDDAKRNKPSTPSVEGSPFRYLDAAASPMRHGRKRMTLLTVNSASANRLFPV